MPTKNNHELAQTFIELIKISTRHNLNEKIYTDKIQTIINQSKFFDTSFALRENVCLPPAYDKDTLQSLYETLKKWHANKTFKQDMAAWVDSYKYDEENQKIDQFHALLKYCAQLSFKNNSFHLQNISMELLYHFYMHEKERPRSQALTKHAALYSDEKYIVPALNMLALYGHLDTREPIKKTTASALETLIKRRFVFGVKFMLERISYQLDPALLELAKETLTNTKLAAMRGPDKHYISPAEQLEIEKSTTIVAMLQTHTRNMQKLKIINAQPF